MNAVFNSMYSGSAYNRYSSPSNWHLQWISQREHQRRALEKSLALAAAAAANTSGSSSMSTTHGGLHGVNEVSSSPSTDGGDSVSGGGSGADATSPDNATVSSPAQYRFRNRTSFT
jgi:hypothetical protein